MLIWGTLLQDIHARIRRLESAARTSFGASRRRGKIHSHLVSPRRHRSNNRITLVKNDSIGMSARQLSQQRRCRNTNLPSDCNDENFEGHVCVCWTILFKMNNGRHGTRITGRPSYASSRLLRSASQAVSKDITQGASAHGIGAKVSQTMPHSPESDLIRP